jgi:hypothetical protein
MRILIILLLSFTFVGCACPFSKERKVNHVVLCWFKDPGNKEQRADMIRACRTLRDIPGVLEVRVGEAIPNDKEHVDDSFDVAIYLSYASVEDLKNYGPHPIHQKAIKESIKPYLKKILVYDFFNLE